MRDRQRALGSAGDVVIEGRDIGAVVAPDAAVKVYLEADPEERARRRVAERPGIGADALVTDLKLRDSHDAANTHLAEGAILIDTTGLTLDEVVSRIAGIVAERRA
jgi:cytidylate kinase